MQFVANCSPQTCLAHQEEKARSLEEQKTKLIQAKADEVKALRDR